MSIFIKKYRPGNLSIVYSAKVWRLNSTSADKLQKKTEDEEEFRVLDIIKKRTREQRKFTRRTDVHPDRADRMPTNQNWGNVWPGPKTFHPSSVPLPLHQGYVSKGNAPPGKKANAELMKIPNFLHLTPPVIQSQCEALKKYCTEWPALLNAEEAIDKHYPQEIITSDYCHASPSIRNPLSRVVTLRIKLSNLKLDKHARDKFLRLVSGRYYEETDLVTITADRCPVRIQNLDYVNYLLTACYHEAWNIEDWEADKSEDDMEYYDWDKNISKKNLITWYFRARNEETSLTDEEYCSYDVTGIPNAEEYKTSVSDYYNQGESADVVLKYGDAVRKLFGLPQRKADEQMI